MQDDEQQFLMDLEKKQVALSVTTEIWDSENDTSQIQCKGANTKSNNLR